MCEFKFPWLIVDAIRKNSEVRHRFSMKKKSKYVKYLYRTLEANKILIQADPDHWF